MNETELDWIESTIRAAIAELLPLGDRDEIGVDELTNIAGAVGSTLFEAVAIRTREVAKAEAAKARFIALLKSVEFCEKCGHHHLGRCLNCYIDAEREKVARLAECRS